MWEFGWLPEAIADLLVLALPPTSSFVCTLVWWGPAQFPATGGISELKLEGEDISPPTMQPEIASRHATNPPKILLYLEALPTYQVISCY